MTRDAYGQAYQEGFEMTVRFLCSRGVPYDNADEVAQTAWVRGWERLAQLRDESLVVTWVNTIALNVYRGLLRRKPMTAILFEQRDRTVGINLAAIDIARVLTFCRPSNRILLQQCMSGVTAAEIAQKEGVSETAIRIRLLRARRDARSSVEGKKSVPTRASVALAMVQQNAA